MSERERWIVYPLLFLALGAALRDKLVDRTTTKSIVCEELTVVDEEPIGNQAPRVLAKIGRTERTANAPSIGFMVINGQLEVVDRDPAAQPARSLVKLGRTERAVGKAASGYIIIDGQVLVNGAINAYQYAFQGQPFLPTFQAVPGITLPDLLRALQQQSSQQQPDENAPGSKRPANDPPKRSSPKLQPQAEEASPPAEQRPKE